MNIKIKNTIKILTTLLFFFVIININLKAQFQGSGTANDPYQIWTREDMELLADSVNYRVNYSKGKHFKVMQDITDSVRKMIGRQLDLNWYEVNDYLDNTPLKTTVFEGHFDGGNHKVTVSLDLANNSTGGVGGAGLYAGQVALFGTIYNATIENLTIDGFIKARKIYPNGFEWGGAIGFVIFAYRSEITNCHNNKVIYDAFSTIGFGGFINSTIRDCNNYSEAEVGIGGGTDLTVINCNNYGNGGGLISGITGNGLVLNSNNYGNITASVDRGVSGIIMNVSPHIIEPNPDTFWVDWSSKVVIENSNNYGNITAGTAVGIGGGWFTTEVINCNNYGNLTGLEGGVIGVFSGATRIINCHNYGNITATGYWTDVYGIGWAWDSLYNCINWGNIELKTNGSPTTYSAKGIGFAPNMFNCINLGNVINNHSGVTFGNGRFSYSNASVFGGLLINNVYLPPAHFTWFQPTTHINLINAGFITGHGIVSGYGVIDELLVGYERNPYTVKNFINVGVVAPFPCIEELPYIGAIVGKVNTKYPNPLDGFSNCFYDKQLCEYGGIEGRDYAGKAEGRLTTELVGEVLRSILGDDAWEYNAGLYPTLKQFSGTKAGKVASSPVFFDAEEADFDTHKKLRKSPFTVSLANDVQWYNAFDNVIIEGNQGKIIRAGRDTLYCEMLDTVRLFDDSVKIFHLRKTIPITVVDTFRLTVLAAPAEGGTVEIIAGTFVDEIGNYFNDTSLITVQAKPTKCHRFVCWTDSATGETVSSDAVYRFCFPPNDLTLIAHFIKDTFNLALRVNPPNAGTVNGSERFDGRFPCEADTFAIIEAEALGCYEFVNWTISPNWEVFSENQIDTIKMDTNYRLYANFRKEEVPVVRPNPLEFGIVLANIPVSRTLTISNPLVEVIEITEIEFLYGEHFSLVPNLTEIFLDGLREMKLEVELLPVSTFDGMLWDSLKFIVKTPKCEDTVRIFLRAYITETSLTVIASEHNKVSPAASYYSIPFYVQAFDPYVLQGYNIEKLEFTIDRRVFFPRDVNNGNLQITQTDSLNIFTVSDIIFPQIQTGLPFDTEIELFCLVGDMLLGDKDSAEIALTSIEFSAVAAVLENGYITLEICEEGGRRLLSFGYEPAITVKNITVSEMLEVNCKTVERGSYSLEIVDISGAAVTVETWTVTGSTRIFDFKIDVSGFAIGTYFIVMNTPTNKYSARFVKQ